MTPNPSPFTVRASCNLTEDYFLTSEILLDISNGDRVIPFVNPMNGNVVEAIVFSASINDNPASVSHLQRNLSVPSGWSFTQIDTSAYAPYPIDIAVAADDSTVYLMVLTDPSSSPGAAWLTQLDSATEWDAGYGASYDDLGYIDLDISPEDATFGALKGGIDPAGHAYFYASAVEDQTTYLVGWVTGPGWSSGDFNYQLLQTLDSTSAAAADYIVLFDTSASANPVGYSLVLTTDGNLTGYTEVPFSDQATAQFNDGSINDDIGSIDVTELIWAWATPGSTTGQPGYALQWTNDPANNITAGTVFVDENGNDQILSDQSTVGNNAVSVWQSSGLWTVNLLDANDTLSTTAQYTDQNNDAQWGSAIPIGVGLAAVFSVPTDPNQTTLFAVDPGGVLNVLTKSVTGWTQNVVHQDAATSLEVVSWRCELGLYDANGVGVGSGNGSIELGTSLPIDIWQNNTSIVLLPSSPVTLTQAASGELSVSIPTSELDTAQLTALPLDADGKPNGPPLTIVPNTDVQGFLAGTSPLNSVGGTPLTGTALMGAQNGTWDGNTQSYAPSAPLMPTLVTAGTAASDQVATAMAHVMSLPTNNPNDPTNPSGTAQAGLLDFTGSAPSFATSSDPTAYDSHKTGDTHWWDKAEHDAKSAYHGLRHAAMAVKKMITTWAADAAQWTINLVIDLGDGIERLMNWVVSGIEDAYHAVSSFFVSLGTDIEHVWNWVKDVVLSALVDAGSNAKYMEAWVENLVDFTVDAINSLEHQADNFFKNLETDVNTKLTTLQDQLEDELFGTHTEQPTPDSGTGGDDSKSHFKGAQDVFHFLGHSPGKWFMKKLTSDLGALEGGALDAIQYSNFSAFATDLANDVDEVVDTIVDMAKLLADLLEDAATSATSFNAEKMTDLFTGFENVADDVLTLLDDLVDSLLDLLKAFIESLNDLITSEFPPPFIGELLRLVGVDWTPRVLHLTALAVAYPASMLHALWAVAAGDGTKPLFPFDQPTSNAAVGSSDADWAGFGLDVAAAVTQFVWATNEAGIEMIAYTGGTPTPFDLTLLDFFTLIDIICPMLIMIFQWPVPPGNTGQTPAPLHDRDFEDGALWGNEYKLLYPSMIAGVIPWLMEAAGFVIASFDKKAGKRFNDNAVPTLQSLASFANLLLGSWYSYSNATNDGEKTLAIIPPVISDLSYIDAVIAAGYTLNALGNDTAWIKFYIDTFGNYATVAIDIGEAIAAVAE
ncbi:MAG TPA: hypothetical protein VGP36_13100 [Mycobacteriales bacterium]|nr:hypothetical protein [Mycobacteriales bacterium]